MSPHAGAGGALRRFLVVAAALVLLGHGAVEVAPRLTAAGAIVVGAAGGAPTASRPGSARPVAEAQPLDRRAAERATGVSGLVPPAAADPAAASGTRLGVAPPVPVRPAAHPSDDGVRPGAVGGVDGRAPPGPAGP